MAMKIPDAPNVIGTQPVLRQPDSINARFENPNFKIDVSAPAQAIKDVGDAYASFVDQQTETLMGAACNQFSHDVREEENRLKNTYKGIYANDLYARLEKTATNVLNDMTGAPKDDGRVRIANPELQKRFRDWASRQMPAYHARMTNYTASEIEKANRTILEDGIKQVNNMVAGATTTEELMAANEEYMRAARLSAPGMPKGYQVAEAARMMDEALLKKMSTLAKTDVLKSINLYAQIPEIGAGMSSTSEAAWRKIMQDNFVAQGGARSADLMAGELPTTELGGYTDKNIIRFVYPNASEAEIDRIIVDVRKKGDEVYQAAREAKRGQDEKEYALMQTKIVNTDITDPNAVMNTVATIAAFNPELANQYYNDVQTQMYEAGVEYRYNQEFPFGDEAMTEWESRGKAAAEAEYDKLKGKFRAERGYGVYDVNTNEKIDKDFIKEYGTQEQFLENRKATQLASYVHGGLEKDMASVLGKDMTEELLGRSINEEPEVLSQERYNILQKQREIVAKNTEWINSPVYARVYAEAIDGRYHGEYRPELEGCPLILKKNLASVVEWNRRYNEVVSANPHIASDITSALPKEKKKNNIFVGAVQREVVKGMDAYSRNPAHKGSYPVKGSIEYNQIINQAIHNAVSPTEARVGAYLNEQQIDLLQKAKLDPYLNPGASIKKLKENNMLPNEAVVLLNNDYSAKDIADAIIDTAEGAKKRRLEMYRDAMIQSMELTGNYDGWFLFADGIGQ